VLNALHVGLRRLAAELRPSLPGLCVVLVVALVARRLHAMIPSPAIARAVSEVFLAVVLGLLLRNTLRLSGRLDPGIKFALQRILRLGIILLGLRLSLQDVVGTGLSALLLILACMVLALALAHGLGRLLEIPPRLAILIGVGTAVCGNSAIIATAPVIEAKDEEVSFAVATITCFGTLAVLVYPTIGYLASLTDRAFGLWAGTAILDTSQVVAAGAAFSEQARDTATVVKLVRNTLMAPVIVMIGLLHARAENHGARRHGTGWTLSKVVPWFVLGFLAMTLLRTLGIAAGVLPQDLAHPGTLTAAATAIKGFDEVAKFAILMALSAIGLGTNMHSLRRVGPKPILLGFGVAGSLAVFSLAVIHFVMGGG